MITKLLSPFYLSIDGVRWDTHATIKNRSTEIDAIVNKETFPHERPTNSKMEDTPATFSTRKPHGEIIQTKKSATAKLIMKDMFKFLKHFSGSLPKAYRSNECKITPQMWMKV